MFSKFDECTKGFVEEAKEYSKRYFSLSKIGTEAFIRVMFDDEDSILRIIFDDYNITSEQIDEVLGSLMIIRKDDALYTDKFVEVMHLAEVIALDNDSNSVLEEHLVYALFSVQNSVFSEELKLLNLSKEKLIEDLKEFFENVEDEDLRKYTTNLSNLAKEHKLSTLIGCEDYLKRMRMILERKNKNNIILIGNAGVGKTALVEGLATSFFNEMSKYKIISLNLSSLVANTKYRGDFEARINKVLNMAINNPNLILFIDEIHMIMGAGQTESSMDAANILKPYLARGDFRCIGATTIDEYNKTLSKDKALARRFQTILVNEPTSKETSNIIKGIMPNYESYHKVKGNNFIADYLVKVAVNKISNRTLPDKAIDLLDEAMVVAKNNHHLELDVKDVDCALTNITGVREGNLNYHFIYQDVYNYYLNNALSYNEQNFLLKASYFGSNKGLEVLKQELKIGFGIADEMVLEINMAQFLYSEGITTLIGTPPGYIGYDDGGILSEHFAKYPYQIIIFKDFSKCSSKISRFINNMLKDGIFFDSKGRSFKTKNAVFIFAEEVETKDNIGFIAKKRTTNGELILREQEGIKYENASFLELLNEKGYVVSVDHKEFMDHELIFKKSLVTLTREYNIGNYKLSYNPQTEEAEIKRLN